MPLDASVLEELHALERQGLLRRPRTVDGPQGPHLIVDGHRVLSFCSNNYLGLADHPDLRAAARGALDAHALGAGASRLISGTMQPHRDAEERLAAYLHAEGALLFATGYAANTGTIPALASAADDVVFSDALNHASLIDGCRLARASVHVYRHADPEHLDELLTAHRPGARRCLIVTDGLFSMDGDRAPVAALRRLADRHDAALVVDEAHALGVLGPSGRGVCAEAGVIPDVLIGTLGKAFGVAGAFVAATRPVLQLLTNRARSFVFSTAPMPVAAQVVRTATDLVEVADDRRTRLAAHARRLRTALRAVGYDVPDGDTPIIPVLLGTPERAMQMSSQLFERGLFVQGIRPPTVPNGTSRLRIVPMATHEDAHIDRLADTLGALAEEARR